MAKTKKDIIVVKEKDRTVTVIRDVELQGGGCDCWLTIDANAWLQCLMGFGPECAT